MDNGVPAGNGSMGNLLAVVGFGLQYLRAMPKFSDAFTVLLVLVTALLGSLVDQVSFDLWTKLVTAQGNLEMWRAAAFLANDLSRHGLIVMGGLGIAMMASHAPGPVRPPKFNEFGKEE